LETCPSACTYISTCSATVCPKIRVSPKFINSCPVSLSSFCTSLKPCETSPIKLSNSASLKVSVNLLNPSTTRAIPADNKKNCLFALIKPIEASAAPLPAFENIK